MTLANTTESRVSILYIALVGNTATIFTGVVVDVTLAPVPCNKISNPTGTLRPYHQKDIKKKKIVFFFKKKKKKKTIYLVFDSLLG